jgi:NADP-dependent 3-hydroxy acid dehydrogenase YdfG
VSTGANLVVTARRKERLDALKDAIEKEFPEVAVHTMVLDMQDTAAVAGLPESLPEKFQAIDVLVNNAGKALGVAPVGGPSLPTSLAADPHRRGQTVCVCVRGRALV